MTRAVSETEFDAAVAALRDAPLDVPGAAHREEVRTALLARAHEGNAIVIHADGAWHFALGMLLELDRDGIDLRVTSRDRWILGRQTPLAGEGKALHVWFDTSYDQLAIAKCIAPLATFGDLHVLASEHDVEACP